MLLSSRKARDVFVLCCGVAFLLLTAPALRAQVTGLPDFTGLYEKQGPTVVSIDVRQKARGYPMMGMSEDDPFYEFFRRFGMPQPQQRRSEPEGPQAMGSGFIISADGYVVTNAHVIEGADDVKVKLTDKNEYTAKVIGSDKRTDVALLKIEAGHPLPTVTIGDPEKLKVGEWVVAIGKPFGLENTMTAGIVSAKGRDLPQENLVPFIQTDTAINPGNSGGPLFNLKGEVVGINSLIYSRSGGFMGLSFAIPIDVAMNIINQLKATGKVTRGRIGVVIQEVSKDAAEAFGLKSTIGALVNSVEKGSPADKAGLKSGDIILKADGREVRNSSELPRIITMLRPGSKTELTLWRDGATKNVSVTIAESEDDSGSTMGRPGKGSVKPNLLGLVLSDLTAVQKQQLEIKNGVLVEDIRGSIRGNLQPGDVIIAVIQRGAMVEAKSAAQLNGVLGKLDKKAPITLQVLRDGNYFFATIRSIEE